MYLSRIDLKTRDLPIQMVIKAQESGLYATHQWLWQLFVEQEGEVESAKRSFLFRQEEAEGGWQFYLLSPEVPNQAHNLFRVSSKPFTPMLEAGQWLQFSLRANPVITRNGKRSDVLMDAKHHAPEDLAPAELWLRQEAAAKAWLMRQGDKHGFDLVPEQLRVSGYRQHGPRKPRSKQEIRFSSVDYDGLLQVTKPEIFVTALTNGFGKCKGLGCGLMLIRRSA